MELANGSIEQRGGQYAVMAGEISEVVLTPTSSVSCSATATGYCVLVHYNSVLAFEGAVTISSGLKGASCTSGGVVAGPITCA